MRTREQIDAEIANLRKLKPIGAFKQQTQAKIDLMIEELEHGYDQTSGEWNELCDAEQCAVVDAKNWKEGFSEDRPSQDWGALVKKGK